MNSFKKWIADSVRVLNAFSIFMAGVSVGVLFTDWLLK